MSESQNGSFAARASLKGRSSAETVGAVLELIRAAGEISRVELARRSALTETTISKIVRELTASGLVVQSRFADSTGGKPAALFRMNDRGVYALGVTVDVNESVIVLCGADGSEVARTEVRGFGDENPADSLDRLAAAIMGFVTDQGIEPDVVLGLGVAAAGRVGLQGVEGPDASLRERWEDVRVAEELGVRTGLPVVRENDANCAALTEYWSSPEPDHDFAMIYMSHGIGSGIVIGGTLYHGRSGNAGEIGHAVIDPFGRECWCGSRGCLETVSSPIAMVRDAVADPVLSELLELHETADFADVYARFTDLFAQGVPRARAIVDQAAEFFAAAVLGMVNTLDLDLVVLSGSGFGAVGETFVAATANRVRRTAFMRDTHLINVRLASASSDTAALGAATAVLNHHLTPHRIPLHA